MGWFPDAACWLAGSAMLWFGKRPEAPLDMRVAMSTRVLITVRRANSQLPCVIECSHLSSGGQGCWVSVETAGTGKSTRARSERCRLE
eukprot:2646484-Alexandrium_andersonii.AAC.1